MQKKKIMKIAGSTHKEKCQPTAFLKCNEKNYLLKLSIGNLSYFDEHITKINFNFRIFLAIFFTVCSQHILCHRVCSLQKHIESDDDLFDKRYSAVLSLDQMSQVSQPTKNCHIH